MFQEYIFYLRLINLCLLLEAYRPENPETRFLLVIVVSHYIIMRLNEANKFLPLSTLRSIRGAKKQA